MGGEGFAFVTFVDNDTYALGAITLGHSLRRTKTEAKLVIFVCGTLTSATREILQQIWDVIIDTETIISNDDENLALLSRPELGVTLTKLRVWTLTQFDKCVFMDADTVVLSNIDDLFERSELSAARDTGWPDCFNTGVFVLQPSKETYDKLLDHMVKNGSFDGGDQGLLNTFFGDQWQGDLKYHLPFTYNMVASTSYTYAPAIKQYGKEAKVVHFLGATKPWHYSYDSSNTAVIGMPQGSNTNTRNMIGIWWNTFLSAQRTYAPHSDAHTTLREYQAESSRLPPHSDAHTTLREYQAESSRLPGKECEEVIQIMASMSIKPHATGQLSMPTPAKPELTPEQYEAEWRQSWKNGNIDYNGRDGFQNISKELKRSISDE